MELVAGPRAGESEQFGPFFLVRKSDGAVIGEIGSTLDAATATAPVGYTVVASCWGQGYATEALRALVAVLLARADVRRVVSETMVDHAASRRVTEKADMRLCGQRAGEEDGESVELVAYELLP
ncbi:MAG: hypothetical protein CYG61_04550 [Actinobacteria bacterium]|nr:MAG: hypothetical protein CYG61_04550 [Actinomycetota bacterium]